MGLCLRGRAAGNQRRSCNTQPGDCRRAANAFLPCGLYADVLHLRHQPRRLRHGRLRQRPGMEDGRGRGGEGTQESGPLAPSRQSAALTPLPPAHRQANPSCTSFDINWESKFTGRVVLDSATGDLPVVGVHVNYTLGSGLKTLTGELETDEDGYFTIHIIVGHGAPYCIIITLFSRSRLPTRALAVL